MRFIEQEQTRAVRVDAREKANAAASVAKGIRASPVRRSGAVSLDTLSGIRRVMSMNLIPMGEIAITCSIARGAMYV